MHIPESTVSPDANMVYDRQRLEWVDVKNVPLWQICLSNPLLWAIIANLGTLLFS